ncbi:hypothetical protein [Mannheimia haemolytica]
MTETTNTAKQANADIIYRVFARDLLGNHLLKGSYASKSEAWRKVEELVNSTTPSGQTRIYDSVYITPINPHTGQPVL